MIRTFFKDTFLSGMKSLDLGAHMIQQTLGVCLASIWYNVRVWPFHEPKILSRSPGMDVTVPIDGRMMIYLMSNVYGCNVE